MELSMMTFMLEFPILLFKQGTREEKVKEIEALHKHGYNDTLAIEFVPMPGKNLKKDMKRVYDMFASRI